MVMFDCFQLCCCTLTYPLHHSLLVSGASNFGASSSVPREVQALQGRRGREAVNGRIAELPGLWTALVVLLNLADLVVSSGLAIQLASGNCSELHLKWAWLVRGWLLEGVVKELKMASMMMDSSERVEGTDARDGGPLPMKFFSTWEVRKVPPNCVSR